MLCSSKMFKIVFFFIFGVVVCATDPQPIRCSELPDEILRCIGSPVIVPSSVSSQCQTGNKCQRTTCIFRSAGWLSGEEVDKVKVSSYLTQFAREHPAWETAVQRAKVECVDKQLTAQGVFLGCPTYDIVFCVMTSFIQSAPATQWSSSGNCEYLRQWAAVCPTCPEDCFAAAIPIGSCNACTVPPKRT